VNAPALDPALRLTAQLALSLLFVWAASHKLRDVAAFRAAVASYELLPLGWARVGAALLIGAEIAIGAGLWFPAVAVVAVLGAAGLLAVYAGAMALNLARGRRDIACGCGGLAAEQPLRGALVARNGVLIVVALGMLAPTTTRPLTWVDTVTVAAGVAVLTLLYRAVDGLLANAPKLGAVHSVEHA